MPYVGISTGKALDKSQKDALKAGLGEMMALLPNKTEKQLMVDIAAGHTMYLAGEEKADCAFLDVRIYGAASFEAQAGFNKAAFELLQKVAGIQPDDVYISFGGYNTWGLKGVTK